MARPYCYRCELGLTYPACALACADELERVVAARRRRTIGAVIVEPVQGVGGVIVPPPGYFERLRAICDRHEILLVVDEVITGFGRLGHVRSASSAGRSCPTCSSFAKGVTSGYQPLGGVILHERVYRTLLDAGPDFTLHHGFTYSGHPVACAAGLANLDIIEREGLVARRRAKGALLPPRASSASRRSPSSATSAPSASWRRSRSSRDRADARALPAGARVPVERPRRRARAAASSSAPAPTPSCSARRSSSRAPRSTRSSTTLGDAIAEVAAEVSGASA